MRRWLRRQPWVFAAAAQVLLLVLLYRQFVYRIDGERVYGLSDDIYIAACYARNLADGYGLVWYPGAPKVEGFSDPLWVGLLAIVHTLPGVREEGLGMYVLLMNAALLAAISAVLWLGVRRVLVQRETDSTSGVGGKCSRPGKWSAIILLGTGLSMPYWLAEGFEVGLVALLALIAYVLAVRKRDHTNTTVAVGLLAGLAFWARMDALIYFSGSFLLIVINSTRRMRQLAALSLSSLLLVAFLFAARRLYFGQWLPNTYYLKLSGWPLQDRLWTGFRYQNWPVLPQVVLVWVLFAIPRVRRYLGAVTRPVAAALIIFTLSVAYSTSNGGDAWGLKGGYDRFMVTGALFLVLALAVVVRLAERHNVRRIFLAAWLVALMPLATLAIRPARLKSVLTLLKSRPERHWSRYGKVFEEVSKPGARLALGAAGAMIYFSHRGGVDLLGKCDPLVAHQPPLPGGTWPEHNKRNDVTVFKARKPEFSSVLPPDEVRKEYCSAEYKSCRFWVLRNTAYARWDKLTLPDR